MHLDVSLRESGLELMEDSNTILVEKIKTSIVDLVHYNNALLKKNLSDYLGEKLNHNYTYLSNLFSKLMGTIISWWPPIFCQGGSM